MASPYPNTPQARNEARRARANRRNASPPPPGIPEQGSPPGSPLAPPPNISEALFAFEPQIQAPEQVNVPPEGDTEPYEGEYDNPPISLDADDIDALASIGEEELGELVEDGELTDQEILPPLEIEPTSIINDNKKGYTYADIVKLLEPLTSNVANKDVPVCNEVHKLMGDNDDEKTRRMNKIFSTFIEIIGEDNIQKVIDTKYDTDNFTSLKIVAVEFYKLLLILLGKHNADEAIDADSHVFDDISHRELLAKHAVFHFAKIDKGGYIDTIYEGIMHHPYFTAAPNLLLTIIMFIECLPFQVQVFWAQYYITTFITGYGQTLETFDPELIGSWGFIASCIGGNLEKMLLAIGIAITRFYKNEYPVEESPEEELRTLKNALKDGSVFQEYYKNVAEELSIDSYREYIKNKDDIRADTKAKYLTILADDSFVAELQPNFLLGGRKKMRRKRTLKKNTKRKNTKRKNTKRKHITRKFLNKKTNKRINRRKHTRRHKV